MDSDQRELGTLKEDKVCEQPPVHFYVVRHGQTLFNVMGKIQGWCDTPLTPKGRYEAQALGRMLAGIDFVSAYASDSGRAVQTLDNIVSARSRLKFPSYPTPPIRYDARLREWCYGDLEGEPGELLHATLAAGFGSRLSFTEHNSRLPEVADVLVRADCSGRVEHFDAIERRLKGFFCEVGTRVRQKKGGNVLVVTHSFTIRTLVYLLDPARINNPEKIPNASITFIDYDHRGFTLGKIGATTL